MKRRVILFVLLAVLLSGSVSADRKKLGEGDRSFFYYLYEDFTLENAEGKKLVYKDTEFSGDMDYMVSGNTTEDGSVFVPDSEYFIYHADSDKAKLRMQGIYAEEESWWWFVEGTNIETIRMSARGVEVLGDDMSYDIAAWDGIGFINICGEQEKQMRLAADIKKKGATGIGFYSEKAPAQMSIRARGGAEEILAKGTNERGHWTHLANTEGTYQLKQYEGDGRFPDVVTGKREWPLYGKILVVALPVTAVAAAALVISKKRKNKPVESE